MNRFTTLVARGALVTALALGALSNHAQQVLADQGSTPDRIAAAFGQIGTGNDDIDRMTKRQQLARCLACAAANIKDAQRPLGQQLEQLVQEMERGELSLDVALTKFQDGIVLARACQTYLKDAEQKVSILTKDNATLKPMTKDEDDADYGF